MNTWADLVDTELGRVFSDIFIDGVRVIVLRGPASLCAYIGVPVSHPLSGFEYDDINLDCHGGLTYSSEGNGEYLPKGLYWYGWDYAHSGDKVIYDTYRDNSTDREWLPSDVEKEAKSVLLEFSRLMKLSERVHNRAIIDKTAYPVDR